MFATQPLVLLHQLMNDEMSRVSTPESKSVSKSVLLKLFSIIILTAKFEIGSRAFRWSTTTLLNYLPARAFERTRRRCQRFFSFVACNQEHRWKSVDYFINSGGNRLITSSTIIKRRGPQTCFPQNKYVLMSLCLDAIDWVATGLVLWVANTLVLFFGLHRWSSLD